MANKPATYEPEANYRITVNRVVQVGGAGAVYLRPSSHNIVVSGAYAQTIDDAIVTAEKIG
jgi:hypothetical protein